MLNKIAAFFKKEIKITHFAWIMGVANLLFFHLGFFSYILSNLKFSTFNNILLIVSFVVLITALNVLVYLLLLILSKRLGKTFLIITFLASSIAVYFVNTYHVAIDKTVIGHMFNTNYSEAGGFFSVKWALYVIFLGVLPALLIAKAKLKKVSGKSFTMNLLAMLAIVVVFALANVGNWLWIDKNGNTLRSFAMPWSYITNIPRYYAEKRSANEKEILLPDAAIQNNEKAVVVLVIGESARSQNFSLYGYEKNTNPLLSATPNVHHFPCEATASYTTAALKAILEHKKEKKLYEILPNYLYRNNVDVVWRTTNTGEPPVHVPDYQKADYLKTIYKGEFPEYDEVLLSGLKEQILGSKNDKVLIVLHTGTSHGPAYSKKYPPGFEVFKPVCDKVELAKCVQSELINAYDNTIVYTDYLLHGVIESLIELEEYQSTMIFVSDHGESLGENNLYMHGSLVSMAPREQLEIPFIVWVSDNSKSIKPITSVSQQHVFHSVLHFLSVDSPIYNEEMNIFK